MRTPQCPAQPSTALLPYNPLAALLAIEHEHRMRGYLPDQRELVLSIFTVSDRIVPDLVRRLERLAPTPSITLYPAL